MSLAKKCDICGALYGEYNNRDNSTKPNGIMYLNIDIKLGYFKHEPIDCCPECMESIKTHIDWLKNGKKPIDPVPVEKGCRTCEHADEITNTCAKCDWFSNWKEKSNVSSEEV